MLLLTLLSAPGWSAAPTVSALEICIDQSDWYPQTFAVRGEARGVHVDIIRCALVVAGFESRVRPLPWPRCLHWVSQGQLSAAATATFTKERAQQLLYPPDAATLIENSRWAVGYDQDLVVTPSESRYVYAGELASLPKPVRVPRGWSIASELRALGVDVDDGATGDEDNLHKLSRDRHGSVIATATSLDSLMLRPAWQDALRVQAVPVRQRAYHLVFSKAANTLTPTDRQVIWDAVERVREDARLMAAIQARYAPPPPEHSGKLSLATLSQAGSTLDCSLRSR